MKLDYRFQPIDITIEGHPKAWAAGVEAMGLWLWGMVHARQHKTGGHITRTSALGAWGGKRNIMLAKRLVESGLWLERDDGSWDIWNFEAKSAGNASEKKSTERVKRHRERLRNGDETQSETRFASISTSPSLSVSSDLSDLASPPDWWAGVCDLIDGNHGVTLNRGGAWLGYVGHRTDKNRGVNQADAISWLTRVDVPALRKEREERRHREDRDKAYDAARREKKVDYTPKYEQPTAAQAKAMADELSRRVRALGPQPTKKVGT